MMNQLLLRAFGKPGAANFSALLRRQIGFGFGLLLVLVTTGCQQGSSNAPVPTDSSMLRGVVSTYRIATRDLGRPPQNIDELKTVLAPVAEDPSEYLRSKRDGEEFVVVWGLNLDATALDTIVAYERTGADGKRMVVSVAGDVRDVSPEEFAQLKFPKDYQP